MIPAAITRMSAKSSGMRPVADANAASTPDSSPRSSASAPASSTGRPCQRARSSGKARASRNAAAASSVRPAAARNHTSQHGLSLGIPPGCARMSSTPRSHHSIASSYRPARHAMSARMPYVWIARSAVGASRSASSRNAVAASASRMLAAPPRAASRYGSWSRRRSRQRAIASSRIFAPASGSP